MSTAYTFNEVDAARFYQFLDHQVGEYTEIRAIEWTTDRKGKSLQRFVDNESDFLKWCRYYTEEEPYRGRYHVYTGVNPRMHDQDIEIDGKTIKKGSAANSATYTRRAGSLARCPATRRGVSYGREP